MKMTKQDKRIKDLETMAVLAAASVIFFLVLKMKLFLVLSIGFLLIGIALKPLASVTSDAWLKVSHVIGTVNSRIILTVIFYVLLTPIALLYRLMVKNPMMIKKNLHSSSYFFDRNRSFSKEEFERTW